MSERKSEFSAARKQAKMAISRWDNEGGAAGRRPQEDAIVHLKLAAPARPGNTEPLRYHASRRGK